MRKQVPWLTVAVLLLTGLGFFMWPKLHRTAADTTEPLIYAVLRADGSLVPEHELAWVGEVAEELAVSHDTPAVRDAIASGGLAKGFFCLHEAPAEASVHSAHVPGATILPLTTPAGNYYLDHETHELTPSPTDAHVALPYYEGLAAVGAFGAPEPDGSTPCTFRYVDRDGKTVIPGPFERALPFVDGMATVAVRDDAGAVKYGAIDRTGAWQIPPTFDQLFEFSDGLAAAQMDNPDHTARKAGFVNTAGEFVVSLEKVQRMKSSHHDGLALVWRTEAPANVFVDRTGAVVLTPEYDQVEPFSEGRAPVLRGEHWGYIDTTGKEVIAPRYFMAMPFQDGLAAVVEAPDGDASPDHFTIEIPIEG